MFDAFASRTHAIAIGLSRHTDQVCILSALATRHSGCQQEGGPMGNLIKKDIKNKLKVEQALVDDVCAFCGFLKADPELASQ